MNKRLLPREYGVLITIGMLMAVMVLSYSFTSYTARRELSLAKVASKKKFEKEQKTIISQEKAQMSLEKKRIDL